MRESIRLNVNLQEFSIRERFFTNEKILCNVGTVIKTICQRFVHHFEFRVFLDRTLFK